MTKPELAKPVAPSNGASASRTAASPETASSHRHALKSAQQGPTIWSPRKASLIGGVALLLLAVLAGLANFGVVEALVTPGDAEQTARSLAESESLFRLGIAALMIVVILDIVVACALMALFQPVNRSVATMAAVFRVAYATVFMVAIGQLASALTLLDNADQALRAVGDFHTIWGAGYALFSVHLVLIGYLVYRSGFAPKFLGVLLILAGLGYLVDEIGSVLVSGYALDVARFSFVGEAVLIFWMLIKGVRLRGSEAQQS